MVGNRDERPSADDQQRISLDLREGGVHDLTPAVWSAFAEAAAVMLERYHSPAPPPRPCELHAGDGADHRACIIWIPATDQTRASHANTLDATEWGAYAVAAMAVHVLHGWRVVGRTQHGSGADLIVMADDDPESFTRLEVSGIAGYGGRDWRDVVMPRLAQKVEQLMHGNLHYPGVAVVVGFEVVHIALSEPQAP